MCLDSAGVSSDWTERVAGCLETGGPGQAGVRRRDAGLRPGLTQEGGREGACCPPGFVPLYKRFEEEEKLRDNAKYVPAITVPGAAPQEFEDAVLKLMGLGITRSEAACHIISVGLDVHNRIMESIEGGFQQSASRRELT